MNIDKFKLHLNKDKWLNAVTIGLFVVGTLCIIYVVVSNMMKSRQISKIGNMACVKQTQILPVNDEHMTGVADKGTNVSIYDDFYNCNEVKHGDLVYYRFSDQIEPVVRVVHGIPGDRYSLTENADKKGSWFISVNGQNVKAQTGEDYLIESNTVPPLKTYELSRGGILGPDEYILLSAKPPGLSDSSNLGLINKKNLVGRVVLKK